MNLLLLLSTDFLEPRRARIQGRRLAHVREVHQAKKGDVLTVGRLGGLMGQGHILALEEDCLDLEVELDQAPPPKLPLHLVLALPRPKVLNRTVAAATSLGVESMTLINAWRVERSYWNSPRMSEENLLAQRILGLEQAKDTILPELHTARFFTNFLQDDLPKLLEGRRRLLAHPYADAAFPKELQEPVLLVVGPEGGFIPKEVESFLNLGFEAYHLGPRILRTETAVATLLGRLF